MFCSKCGTKNEETANFCIKCGNELNVKLENVRVISDENNLDEEICSDDSLNNEPTDGESPMSPLNNRDDIRLYIKEIFSNKKTKFWGVLGAILIVLFAIINILHSSYTLSIENYDTQKFPVVSFDLIINGTLKEDLKEDAFFITEGTQRIPIAIESIDERSNKYRINYTTQYKNKSEEKIEFSLNLEIKDKNYECYGEYVSPKLPEWVVKIENVSTTDYPYIKFDLILIDNINSEFEGAEDYKLEDLVIHEENKEATDVSCTKTGDLKYSIKFKTTSTQRERIELPLELVAGVNGQSISASATFIPPLLDNLTFDVKQVDVYDYPKVKIYCSIKDNNTGKTPTDLMGNFFYINENVLGSTESIKREISKISQLNEKENLNINIVADSSGSMDDDNKLIQAKDVICDFSNRVQFDVGDKLELLSFNDSVYSEVDFTSDQAKISNAVSSLSPSGSTCFYDALYVALNRTAIQEGAKCIIAFTDGMDNISNNTPDSVIELANRYKIPIFIVGIGSDVENQTLQYIANGTGGFYKNINDISNLYEIYNSIYAEQKELYVIEYEVSNSEDVYSERNIQIEYQSNTYGGKSNYNYRPQMILGIENTPTGISKIDDAVGNYLRGFVKAINSNDFSYMESTVEAGSPLYTIQKNYVTTKKVQEQLISYEIIEETMDSNGICYVRVREVYQIQNYSEPIHIKTFENTYSLRQQSNGNWLLISLDDLKVISKTAN